MSSLSLINRPRLFASLLAFAACLAIVIVAPSVASADHGGGHAIRIVQVPCPGWAGSQPGLYAEPLSVAHAQPSFLTAESRIVVNDLDTPITATFTSQVSRVFSIGATAGVTFTGLYDFLNINVSSTITSSTTTAIGVNAQAPVPPYSRVIGDYGVDAYEVSFNAYIVHVRERIGGCWVREDNMGYEVHSALAPTNLQGWRVRLG